MKGRRSKGIVSPRPSGPGCLRFNNGVDGRDTPGHDGAVTGLTTKESGLNCLGLERPPSAPPTLEEGRHFGKEALMVRAALAAFGRFGLELLQQFALPGREVLWRFDRDLDEHVAAG